ncbi:MAG: hypothetical protein ING89_02335 [Rubrivivax sp.]|nr:hypothetical protein [Rubrivivax sp.]
MSNRGLEALVWVLIYGGLLLLALGVFVQRQGGGFGWALIGIGSGVAAIGAVLIFVRSRRGPDR